MKKIGKKCFFIIILLLLLMGLSKISENIAKNDSSLAGERNQKYAELATEKEDTLDMLIMGDSEGYTAFSPMQLWSEQGLTAYNGSQAGQYIQETYYMLKKAFKTQSPKLILLETNILFRDQKPVEDMKTTISTVGKYYFPCFRFHDIWKPLISGKHYQYETYKGFMIRNEVKSYDGGGYMKTTRAEAAISAHTRDYMKKIIKLCKENGASLFLVSIPSPKNYNYAKHNSIKEYAEAEQLGYLNMNLKIKELGIDWKLDSMDKGDHLNLTGAIKATNFLGKYLKNNYEFTDHRADLSYQSWNEQAKTYQKKVQEKLSAIHGEGM